MSKFKKPLPSELRSMGEQKREQTTPEAEATRRETSFLSNLSRAQDDYEWIVANEAWTLLGHESFAAWWGERVQPLMRGLSMRPTRELALDAADRIRAEEADLPPSMRRRERELAEFVGVNRDELRDRPARSTVGVNPPNDDLAETPTGETPQSEDPPVDRPAPSDAEAGNDPDLVRAGDGRGRPESDHRDAPGEAEVSTPSAPSTPAGVSGVDGKTGAEDAAALRASAPVDPAEDEDDDERAIHEWRQRVSEDLMRALASIKMRLEPDPVKWMETVYVPGSYHAKDMPQVRDCYSPEAIRLSAQYLFELAEYLEMNGVEL